MAAVLFIASIVAVGMISYVRSFPGPSFTGPLPPLTSEQSRISRRLSDHVRHIAGDIGGRSIRDKPQGLIATSDYLEQQLKTFGLAVERQVFTADGMEVANIIGERRGSDEIVVFGAHYDTCLGLPGANDNGSGVAATLVLAERLKTDPGKTVRFAFFVN